MSGNNYWSLYGKTSNPPQEPARGTNPLSSVPPRFGSVDIFGKPVPSNEAITSTPPSTIASQPVSRGPQQMSSSRSPSISASVSTHVPVPTPASTSRGSYHSPAQPVGTQAFEAAAAKGPGARGSSPAAKIAETPVQIPMSQMLEGPTVEIVAGDENASPSDRKTCRTWHLAQALLSHASPFFDVECKRFNANASKARIALPTVSPSVFALFVEWLFKGSYDTTECTQQHTVVIASVLAWLLGDKLASAGFQNFAMIQIYATYADPPHRHFAPAELAYILDRSPSSTHLEQFCVSFCATHFKNSGVVWGTLLEWDVVFQNYPSARRLMLNASRQNVKTTSIIRSKQHYMVTAKEKSAQQQATGVVTPAKRAADGKPVQKDATAAAAPNGIGAQAAQPADPVKTINSYLQAQGARADSLMARGIKREGVVVKQEAADI